MSIASQKMSFDQFLSYDDGTDTWYELENRELIAMPVENEIKRRIAMFLVASFLQLGVSFERLSLKTEIAVSSTRLSVRVKGALQLRSGHTKF